MIKIKSLAAKAVIAEKWWRFPFWDGPNADSVRARRHRQARALGILKQESLFFPGESFYFCSSK